MPIAQMATDPPTIADPEPGAPVPRDAIDPDLVKLARTRPKIGAITSAAVVAVSIFYMIRLGEDRRFGAADEAPRPVAVADVIAGKIADESYVSLDAEPMMSHAIRTSRAKGDLGYRVTPARGTGERLWI